MPNNGQIIPHAEGEPQPKRTNIAAMAKNTDT